jgi:hypothetical protein
MSIYKSLDWIDIIHNIILQCIIIYILLYIKKMRNKTSKRKRGGNNTTKKEKDIERSKRVDKYNANKPFFLSKKKNPYSIFTPGFYPDKLIKDFESTKFINQRTLQEDPNNERFINESDNIICYISQDNMYMDDILVEDIFKENIIIDDIFKEIITKKMMKTSMRTFNNAVKNVEKHTLDVNNNFCSNDLDPSYINYSVMNCHALVLLKRNEHIIGLTSLYFHKNDTENNNEKRLNIYIDVICGGGNMIGVGGKLINHIKNLAKMLEMDKILLSSIKTSKAVNFYLKEGFKFDKSLDIECNENVIQKRSNGLCKMTFFV